MASAISFTIGGGLSLFSRFIIAFAVLIVLKSLNKQDKEYDRGMKKLIIFSIVSLVILTILVIVWFLGFGLAFAIPEIASGFMHYHY